MISTASTASSFPPHRRASATVGTDREPELGRPLAAQVVVGVLIDVGRDHVERRPVPSAVDRIAHQEPLGHVPGVRVVPPLGRDDRHLLAGRTPTGLRTPAASRTARPHQHPPPAAPRNALRVTMSPSDLHDARMLAKNCLTSEGIERPVACLRGGGSRTRSEPDETSRVPPHGAAGFASSRWPSCTRRGQGPGRFRPGRGRR